MSVPVGEDGVAYAMQSGTYKKPKRKVCMRTLFLPGDKVFVSSYTWRQWFEATVVETIHYERVTVEFAPHPNMPHRKHVPWGSWSIIRKADNMEPEGVACFFGEIEC